MNRKHKRQYTQGAEAGFTLLELIIVLTLASILGTFVFSIITKSLVAQINMQTKKERSDAAALSLERISRELGEATFIDPSGVGTDILRLMKKLDPDDPTKSITSSTDKNPFIRYVRNTSNNRLMRQSATTLAGLPSDSTSGKKVADNVTVFSSSQNLEFDSSLNVIALDLTFADGSVWQTKVFPMNYGLP
jgi:prepilin-type N-terminal cleavage/methylation domain-containing protein